MINTTGQECHGLTRWNGSINLKTRVPILARQSFSLPPQKVGGFSHVCVWDDDLTPTEHFDGPVFLRWLQQLGLDLVQPMIRRNAHDNFYEGTGFANRPNDTHVHEVETVEVMAPCYSVEVWSSCIWPRVIQEFSSGWGVDRHLHQTSCAPASIYSLGLPLDHNDEKSLPKEGGGLDMEFYGHLVEERHWGRREYTEPLKDFRVSVDSNCHVTMAS